MFTPVAVSAKFLNADGSAASGTLSAWLSSQILNAVGDTSVATTSPLSGYFDAEGRLVAQNGEAFILDATDDVGTIPVGTYYTFTLVLDGAGMSEWKSPLPCQATTWEGAGTATVLDQHAVVTEGSPVIQLVDTIAATSVIGTSIVSEEFDSATVISIDSVANTLTVNQNAGGSGTGIQYTTGIFPLTTLMENAL